MSEFYRLNVRFDLSNEDERKAAQYLAALNQKKEKSRNRFIVKAVLSFLERKENGRDFTLEDIRQVLKEELQNVSFVSTQTRCEAADTVLTEDEQARNDENVLSDLTDFF